MTLTMSDIDKLEERLGDRHLVPELCAAARRSIAPWEPIETAPKDRHVLLYGEQEPHEMVRMKGPRIIAGYWDACDEAWCCVGSTWTGPFYNATHWRDLPPPPSMASGKEGDATATGQTRVRGPVEQPPQDHGGFPGREFDPAYIPAAAHASEERKEDGAARSNNLSRRVDIGSDHSPSVPVAPPLASEDEDLMSIVSAYWKAEGTQELVEHPVAPPPLESGGVADLCERLRRPRRGLRKKEGNYQHQSIRHEAAAMLERQEREGAALSKKAREYFSLLSEKYREIERLTAISEAPDIKTDRANERTEIWRRYAMNLEGDVATLAAQLEAYRAALEEMVEFGAKVPGWHSGILDRARSVLKGDRT